MTSVVDAISAISDEKSLSLFKAVVLSDNCDSSTLTGKLNLTRKQFYSSMKKLMGAGLVRRINGKYCLTSLGKIVFRAQARVEIGIENHWKLKALDSVTMSAGRKGLSAQERQIIIDRLIDNHEIKSILLSK
jgi:predicted transcriptional regulator